MTRRIESPVIFINHWRWLADNGYKKEAASCKRQALKLTRLNYNVIQSYKIMEKITIDYRVSEHMKRIADALEEILRLVKLDQERMKKLNEEN